MSKTKNLLQSLTASHLNSLNQTVGSLETQITSLKNVLRELGSAPADAADESDDEDETEEDEAPAKSKRAKKAAKPIADDEEEDETESDDDESEEENEDEDDDAESDDEESDDSEEDEDEEEKPANKKGGAVLNGAITLKQVVKSLRAYSEKPGKSKKDALKLLKKMGTSNVNTLDPSKYGKLMALMK